jgi:YD repeat-containing protein
MHLEVLGRNDNTTTDVTNLRLALTLTNADGSYWAFSYDFFGQLTSAKKHWSDGSLVAGEQFESTFDSIGNRLTAKAKPGSN